MTGGATASPAPELRHDDDAGEGVQRNRQRDDRADGDCQRVVRENASSRATRIRSASTSGSISRRTPAPSHRRRRARCKVRKLCSQPAGASDVLRAAGTERRLQAYGDAARRTAVAFHPRHHAGGQRHARRARAAAHQDARGCRSKPGHQQRANDAAAGGGIVRPGAVCREPCRPVRDRGAAAGSGRIVRRHCVYRRAADERDRHPDGARRGPRQCDADDNYDDHDGKHDHKN